MMGDVEGDAGDGRSSGGHEPGPEGRTDGLDHLRAAAGELIQACRAVLDVAEELLDDPATMGAVADGLGTLLRGAADLGRRATWGPAPSSGSEGGGEPEAPTGDDADDDRPPSRVQRIRVV